MKAGKVWGVTELLEANGVLEFHRLEARAGGVCSKHKHKYKWNGFISFTTEKNVISVARKKTFSIAFGRLTYGLRLPSKLSVGSQLNRA